MSLASAGSSIGEGRNVDSLRGSPYESGEDLVVNSLGIGALVEHLTSLELIGGTIITVIKCDFVLFESDVFPLESVVGLEAHHALDGNTLNHLVKVLRGNSLRLGRAEVEGVLPSEGSWLFL